MSLNKGTDLVFPDDAVSCDDLTRLGRLSLNDQPIEMPVRQREGESYVGDEKRAKLAKAAEEKSQRENAPWSAFYKDANPRKLEGGKRSKDTMFTRRTAAGESLHFDEPPYNHYKGDNIKSILASKLSEYVIGLKMTSKKQEGAESMHAAFMKIIISEKDVPSEEELTDFMWKLYDLKPLQNLPLPPGFIKFTANKLKGASGTHVTGKEGGTEAVYYGPVQEEWNYTRAEPSTVVSAKSPYNAWIAFLKIEPPPKPVKPSKPEEDVSVPQFYTSNSGPPFVDDGVNDPSNGNGEFDTDNFFNSGDEQDNKVAQDLKDQLANAWDGVF